MDLVAEFGPQDPFEFEFVGGVDIGEQQRDGDRAEAFLAVAPRRRPDLVFR